MSGWMKSATIGALMGGAAVAMYTAMNRDTRRKMVQAVTGTTRKMADQAEKMTQR